jgi:nitroreductase
MDTLEAIRKRRSIRKYTGAPMPRSHLETIIDAGRLAASGYNDQPWDFIVVTQKEILQHFISLGSWIDKVGAVVAVILDPSSPFWMEDGAAAVQNMLIACTALGYGSCWLEGYAQIHEEEYKDLLKIPAGKRLFTLVCLGIADENPNPDKKSLNHVLHWEHF